MSERWTDRRTGFTGSVPPGLANLSFKLNQKIQCSGMEGFSSVTKMSQVEPDGNMSIIKAHGNYAKVVYTPQTVIEESIQGTLIYKLNQGAFSSYNKTSGAIIQSSIGAALSTYNVTGTPSAVKGNYIYTFYTSYLESPHTFRLNIRHKRTGAVIVDFKMTAFTYNFPSYSYVGWVHLGGIFIDQANRAWVGAYYMNEMWTSYAMICCYSTVATASPVVPAGTLLGFSQGVGGGDGFPLLWQWPGQMADYHATSGWQFYACDQGRIKQWPETNIDSVTIYNNATDCPVGMVVAGNDLFVLTYDNFTYVNPNKLLKYAINPATGNLTLTGTYPIAGVDPTSVFRNIQYVTGGIYVTVIISGVYWVRRYSINGVMESQVAIPGTGENVFVG